MTQFELHFHFFTAQNFTLLAFPLPTVYFLLDSGFFHGSLFTNFVLSEFYSIFICVFE